MVLDFGLLSNKDLFPTSDATGEGMGADPDTVIWRDVGIGIVPVGSIIAWAKDLAGTPPILPSFVECNGQVLADFDSPLHGSTIPDLNGSAGTERFLRGQTSSGGSGGTETHDHRYNQSENCESGSNKTVARDGALTTLEGTLPSYYEVVWIMRIK